MVCALLSHGPHVTSPDCDSVIFSYIILSHALLLYSKSRKEKKKKYKRNINNDLAILPSHDSLRMFINHRQEQ